MAADVVLVVVSSCPKYNKISKSAVSDFEIAKCRIVSPSSHQNNIMIMLLPLACGLVNGFSTQPNKATTISMDGASPFASRRAVLQTGTAAASALVFARPESVAAAGVKMPKVDLQEELVGILRVQESCSQQTRLVKTGKFKELQRLNVKRAIRMVIDTLGNGFKSVDEAVERIRLIHLVS